MHTYNLFLSRGSREIRLLKKIKSLRLTNYVVLLRARAHSILSYPLIF